LTDSPAVDDQPLSEDGPVQPVLVPPRGLVATILVIMGALAVWTVLNPTPLKPVRKPSLRLDSWRPSPAALQRLQVRRQALLNKGAATSPAAKKLAAAIAIRLPAYFTLEKQLGVEGAKASPRARRRLAEIEELVRGYALAYGNEALEALALLLARHVGSKVEAGLVFAVSNGTTLAALAQAATPVAAVAEIESAAPGSARAIGRAGLDSCVRGQRVDPACTLVIQSLIQLRILGFARRVPPPRPAIATESLRLLLAYRIEAHTGLSSSRKLQLLDTLAADDATYPATYVRAVLLARAGKYRAAAVHFDKAAKKGQNPRAARANARWCREHLKR